MKSFRLLTMLTLVFALAIGATSCKKVNDADVQANAQTALASNPDAAGVAVAVQNQVATLTGEVKDDATKAYVESTVTAVEGVKSVVNNLTVAPPAPDYTALDASINAALADAIKDHRNVQATVQNGVITVTGEIAERDLPTLMQKLNALSPVQVVNNATVK